MCYNVIITFVDYIEKQNAKSLKKETKMTAKRKNCGFTLIELLVSILSFG